MVACLHLFWCCLTFVDQSMRPHRKYRRRRKGRCHVSTPRTTLTHPEFLVQCFDEYLDVEEQAGRLGPNDDLADLIAGWMMDEADRMATHDAFLRAVVLIVARAADEPVMYSCARNPDQEPITVTAEVPTDGGSWWMLEPMEFLAAPARRGRRPLADSPEVTASP